MQSVTSVQSHYAILGRLQVKRTAFAPLCAAKTPVSAATGSHYKVLYKNVTVRTRYGISMHDITSEVKALIGESGVSDGVVHVLSRHTTTAVVINEMEDRLVDDTRQFLLKLAPAAYPYLHNDIHLRTPPKDERWKGSVEDWRKQEPVNAHSHLLSMLLGNSLAVPVAGGDLQLGTWQSIILVELDGPRTRTVGVQVMGL